MPTQLLSCHSALALTPVCLLLVLSLLPSTARAGATATPALAPAGFDCKTRHLAMEYARKIQPFRSSADFETLAGVLNMQGGGPGGVAQCFNVS